MNRRHPLPALKLVLAGLALALMLIAALPAPGSAAETGITCYDEGHACHVYLDGELHHHGKFSES